MLTYLSGSWKEPKLPLATLLLLTGIACSDGSFKGATGQRVSTESAQNPEDFSQSQSRDDTDVSTNFNRGRTEDGDAYYYDPSYGGPGGSNDDPLGKPGGADNGYMLPRKGNSFADGKSNVMNKIKVTCDQQNRVVWVGPGAEKKAKQGDKFISIGDDERYVVFVTGEFCPTVKDGHNLLFIVDQSGSMVAKTSSDISEGGSDPGQNCGRFKGIQAVLNKIPRSFDSVSQVGLVSFSNTVNVDKGSLGEFRRIRQEKVCNGFGFTNTDRALVEARKIIQGFQRSSPGQPTTVYLITDGRPRYDNSDINSPANEAIKSRTAVAMNNLLNLNYTRLVNIFVGSSGAGGFKILQGMPDRKHESSGKVELVHVQDAGDLPAKMAESIDLDVDNARSQLFVDPYKPLNIPVKFQKSQKRYLYQSDPFVLLGKPNVWHKNEVLIEAASVSAEKSKKYVQKITINYCLKGCEE